MLKQNRTIPPSLKHDSRPNNSVVRSRKSKRPNALKHGIYAGAPLIPGEDPREFDELYADLIDEWKPSGPTLRFALHGLADAMWRMRRLKNFVQTKLTLTTFDPDSPSFDEERGFTMFIAFLRNGPKPSWLRSILSGPRAYKKGRFRSRADRDRRLRNSRN